MLERLELENVGPASAMAMDLAPRMNLITGDNGLGKSFLLDVAWWALTRKWPRDLNPRLTSGYPARPTDMSRSAKLRFSIKTGSGHSRSYESKYSASEEGWPGQPGRPWSPGLVIHAHAGGDSPAMPFPRRKSGRDCSAPIKMRQFIFTHTSGPVPRHAVLGVGGCPIARGRGSARGLVQCRRGRTAEQREPVVDPLSGQALVSAGPLVPSPAPRAQIEPGTEQGEKALSGALVDVEIGA